MYLYIHRCIYVNTYKCKYIHICVNVHVHMSEFFIIHSYRLVNICNVQIRIQHTCRKTVVWLTRQDATGRYLV